MKKNLLLLSALLLLLQQNTFAQCTASIINIPHGTCEGTDIELQASGGGTVNGFGYQWTGPLGFISSNQFVYIAQPPKEYSGVYTVVITDSLGCVSIDSLEIIKNPAPAVYTGGPHGGCLGEATVIYAQDFAGNYGPYTYLWDNGATTATLPILHSGTIYPAPACFMTNMYGCTAANYTTFLIFTYPWPDAPVIEPLSATSFCSGGSVTLTTTNDPNLVYQWYRAASPLAGGTNSDYIAQNGGSFSLKVTNGYSCSATSNIIKVIVFARPAAEIAVTGSLNICNGDSVLLSANSGTGLTYQWKKFGSPVAGATNGSMYVKKKGNYRVLVTNQNACIRLSPLVVTTSNCKIEAESRNSEDSFSIYPNPSANLFNIDLSENEQGKNLQLIISDAIGGVISQETITSSTEKLQFGKHLPAGIYYVQIVKDNIMHTRKIIKTE